MARTLQRNDLAGADAITGRTGSRLTGSRMMTVMPARHGRLGRAGVRQLHPGAKHSGAEQNGERRNQRPQT